MNNDDLKPLSPESITISAYVDAARDKDPELYTFPTLRDTFAMAAISGIMANHEWHNSNQHHVADDAYKIADAMLERRKQP